MFVDGLWKDGYKTPSAWLSILHNVESFRDIALSLTDPDTGDIIRKKGDYTQRQGVCDVPITEYDLM